MKNPPTAQPGLGHLVSLATVLVIIRATDAPAEPAPQGIGAYFSDAIRSAWNRGLVASADTAATLLAILIGGLLWWALLVIVLLIVWRRLRTRTPTGRSTRGSSAP